MSEGAQPQYGGQALIEGVMIRGARHVCVACRQLELGDDGKPFPPADSPVFVQAEPIATLAGRLTANYRAARLPFIRGSIVLLESMELGAKGLRLSASVALGSTLGGRSTPPATAGVLPGSVVADPTLPGSVVADSPDSSGRPAPAHSVSALFKRFGAAGILFVTGIILLALAWRLGWLSQPGPRRIIAVIEAAVLILAVLASKVRREEQQDAAPKSLGEIAVGATMALGLTMGIGIFFLVPALLAGIFQHLTDNRFALNLIEGLVRLLFFFGYLLLISRMENIHRIFQYHGAEHQIIHVHENGLELTPENAAKFPTIHPRCGTAFLAIVLVMSVVVFMFAGWPAWWIRLLLRVVLLPIIAGISYELLKLNSRHPNIILKAFVAPGLWFQKITTQPPTRDQQEVAIAAMDGVLQIERAAGATQAAGANQAPIPVSVS